MAALEKSLRFYYPDSDDLQMQKLVNTILICVTSFILGFFYTTDVSYI